MLNDQMTATAAPDTEAGPVATPDSTTTETASAEQLEQLLVLSQAPLSLEDALQQEAARGDDPVPLTAGRLIKQFAGLFALFLGVGLVTAAVRHYGSDSGLYLGVGAGGAVLFAIGSVVLDPRSRRGGKASVLRFGALSLLLGVGFGLLVGGVLHFSAFPHTGAILVPLGLALSMGAFIARDGRALVGRDLMSAGVTVAGLLVWLGVGLGLLAKKLDPAPTPAASHGVVAGDHGAAAAGDHGGAAAGDHGAAAAGHGEAAAGDHGAAATEGHGTAAAAAHGEAAKADHGTGAADHGEAAKADHGTEADSHGAAPAAGHGAEAKAADHGEAAKADHGTEAKGDSHGAAPAAGHGAEAKADSHGAAASKSHATEKEEEIDADDVLVPRAGEKLKKH